MLPRTHLIQLQRALYDKLKAHARNYLGGLSPKLKSYYHEYQKDFRGSFRMAAKRELIRELLRSDVVFCGDYHSLPQAQKTVILLLQEAVRFFRRKKRPVFLLLEMLEPQDSVYVQSYLRGTLSEERFLKKIGFQDWGFSWENYAPLFRFAKAHGISVLGINRKDATLKQRDIFAAKETAKLFQSCPNAFAFVLAGDLHVAQAHLPAEFKKQATKLRFKKTPLVIHQNNEALYWKLVNSGLEQFAEVMQLFKGGYCVLNTAPWVKLKSHLKWMEFINEKAEGSSLSEVEELDHTHEIQDLVQVLVRFLELDGWAAKQDFDDFEIQGPLELDFLNRLEKDGFYSAKQIQFLSLCLKTFESQFFPRSKTIFLTNLRLTHTAHQAALYLHQKLSGFDGVFDSPKKDFYRFIWVEAIGFLGSKILNPKRKCNGPEDLKTFLRKNKSSENRQAVEIALKEYQCEEQGARFLLPSSLGDDEKLSYYKASKILGALLGNGIYEGVLRNRISIAEIRELFTSSFTGDSFLLYQSWGRRLDVDGLRNVRKKEKL